MNRDGKSEKRTMGEREFLQKIYVHYRSILKLCQSRIWWDRELAKDAAQQTMFQAWHKFYTFRDIATVETWLRQIATNVCITIMRDRNRHSCQEFNEDVFVMSAAVSPRGQIAQQELHYMIKCALKKLPPQYRMAIILSCVGGFSYEEIARALHKSSGTVKTHIFRARQKLQKLLANTR